MGPLGTSPTLSSTWSISHTCQQFTPPVIKPDREFYNQACFSEVLFFLARNTKNIMHIFELLHLVIIPREKDSHASGMWSHTTRTNTSSSWPSCPNIAVICNWPIACQLISWPPWFWLRFSFLLLAQQQQRLGSFSCWFWCRVLFFGVVFFQLCPCFALCLAKLLSSSLSVKAKHHQEQSGRRPQSTRLLPCAVTAVHRPHANAPSAEQDNLTVALAAGVSWLHFGHHWSTHTAWKINKLKKIIITGVILIVTHKQNQGILLFVPLPSPHS